MKLIDLFLIKLNWLLLVRDWWYVTANSNDIVVKNILA